MENSTEGTGNSTFARYQTHWNSALKNDSVLPRQDCGRDMKWEGTEQGSGMRTVTMKRNEWQDSIDFYCDSFSSHFYGHSLVI